MKYRKILSAILALLMIISLIPAAILAEGISAELKDDPTLCTVTFVDTWDHNDPIVISTIEVEAGHVLTEEDFPEPPHHDNIEPIWDTFPGAVITCDTIIQTVYLAADPLISREVTFVDGVTGEILGTATVWAIWWGTPIITADQFPEAPEHEGYTFTGWSIAAGSYIYEDNTTITALYEEKSTCTVTFVDPWEHQDDPIVISTIEVEVGHVLTDEDFPPIPDHGYENLAGLWTVHPGTVVTEDMTISIDYLWVEPLVSYEVTFVDGVTGEILDVVTVSSIWWSTPIIMAYQFPEAPEHDGYTFTGWSIAADSYIHEDTTITALYEEISIIPGDIDGDGQLSMADATLAARMALNLIDHVPSADIDGNGVISMADATMIARMAINID